MKFDIRTVEKSSKINGFQERRLHEAPLISSQPRYDRFDTSPYLSNPDEGFNALFNCRTGQAPLCPVAVPEISCSLNAHEISTAASPIRALHPPPAALANGATSIPLRIYQIPMKDSMRYSIVIL